MIICYKKILLLPQGIILWYLFLKHSNISSQLNENIINRSWKRISIFESLLVLLIKTLFYNEEFLIHVSQSRHVTPRCYYDFLSLIYIIIIHPIIGQQKMMKYMLNDYEKPIVTIIYLVLISGLANFQYKWIVWG